MGVPVVIAENGFGRPVVEVENGLGTPVTVAANGFGTPVTVAANGIGWPVVFSEPLGPLAPWNILAPNIADTAPTVDEELTCTTGAWIHDPTGYAYQWYRRLSDDSFPDESTTGVPAGTTLTPSSGLTISASGTVEDLDIDGTVIIDANNVTLQNCKITSDEVWVVRIIDGHTGVIVQDCEIDGTGTGEGSHGILGTGTFSRNNIYGVENGITVQSGGPTLIEDNYIHDLLAAGAPHYDGIQMDGSISDVTIRHNTVVNTFTQTSAIMIDNYFGSISDIVVDNNYLSGGSYTIFVDGRFAGGGTVSDIHITNNHIVASEYGYIFYAPTAPTWTGNVDAATGVAISLPTAGAPPFTFIDSASAGTAADGDTATTAAIDTTGAGLLICGVVSWNDVAAPTVTDSKGNAWHALTQSTSMVRAQIFWSIPSSVGSGHTATAAGTDYFGGITFAAFGGTPAIAPFDVENGVFGTGNPASAGTGITPTLDNELVIMLVGANCTPGSVGSPFTLMDIITKVADHFGHVMAYSIQTAKVAADPDVTTDDYPGPQWSARIASFKQV